MNSCIPYSINVLVSNFKVNILYCFRLINCFRINTKYMNHMKTVFVETLTYQDGYRIKITILRCINQVNKK